MYYENFFITKNRVNNINNTNILSIKTLSDKKDYNLLIFNWSNEANNYIDNYITNENNINNYDFMVVKEEKYKVSISDLFNSNSSYIKLEIPFMSNINNSTIINNEFYDIYNEYTTFKKNSNINVDIYKKDNILFSDLCFPFYVSFTLNKTERNSTHSFIKYYLDVSKERRYNLTSNSINCLFIDGLYKENHNILKSNYNGILDNYNIECLVFNNFIHSNTTSYYSNYVYSIYSFIEKHNISKYSTSNCLKNSLNIEKTNSEYKYRLADNISLWIYISLMLLFLIMSIITLIYCYIRITRVILKKLKDSLSNNNLKDLNIKKLLTYFEYNTLKQIIYYDYNPYLMLNFNINIDVMKDRLISNNNDEIKNFVNNGALSNNIISNVEYKICKDLDPKEVGSGSNSKKSQTLKLNDISENFDNSILQDNNINGINNIQIIKNNYQNNTNSKLQNNSSNNINNSYSASSLRLINNNLIVNKSIKNLKTIEKKKTTIDNINLHQSILEFDYKLSIKERDLMFINYEYFVINKNKFESTKIEANTNIYYSICIGILKNITLNSCFFTIFYNKYSYHNPLFLKLINLFNVISFCFFINSLFYSDDIIDEIFLENFNNLIVENLSNNTNYTLKYNWNKYVLFSLFSSIYSYLIYKIFNFLILSLDTIIIDFYCLLVKRNKTIFDIRNNGINKDFVKKAKLIEFINHIKSSFCSYLVKRILYCTFSLTINTLIWIYLIMFYYVYPNTYINCFLIQTFISFCFLVFIIEIIFSLLLECIKNCVKATSYNIYEENIKFINKHAFNISQFGLASKAIAIIYFVLYKVISCF